jgi:undecaprenyl-phosphate galactose phosphotransferase
MGEIAPIILSVPPGITGLWQVSGRNRIDFVQRLEMDRWYIRNWSLWMDTVILVKTIQTVLNRKGAR